MLQGFVKAGLRFLMCHFTPVTALGEVLHEQGHKSRRDNRCVAQEVGAYQRP